MKSGRLPLGKSCKQENRLLPRLAGFRMVERAGIEPATPTMSTWCSPAELTLPPDALFVKTKRLPSQAITVWFRLAN